MNGACPLAFDLHGAEDWVKIQYENKQKAMNYVRFCKLNSAVVAVGVKSKHVLSKSPAVTEQQNVCKLCNLWC